LTEGGGLACGKKGFWGKHKGFRIRGVGLRCSKKRIGEGDSKSAGHVVGSGKLIGRVKIQ